MTLLAILLALAGAMSPLNYVAAEGAGYVAVMEQRLGWWATQQEAEAAYRAAIPKEDAHYHKAACARANEEESPNGRLVGLYEPIDHLRPDGTAWWLALDPRYYVDTMGEISAHPTAYLTEAITAWLASPAHRRGLYTKAARWGACLAPQESVWLVIFGGVPPAGVVDVGE